MQLFFKSPFFVQRPKAETKIKISLAKYVSPQKVCGHVEFLKTPPKILQNFRRKSASRSEKKDNKIACVKTIVFDQNLSGHVICTFNSPAKLCRQTSIKLPVRLRSHLYKDLFFSKKVLFLIKVLWAENCYCDSPADQNSAKAPTFFLWNSEHVEEKAIF